MKNKQLKEVLIEFQTQLNDLYQLQLDLNISYNNQAKQLNNDFLKVYEEIYNVKNSKEAEDFLNFKKSLACGLNKVVEQRTDNVIKMFDERFNEVHKNLEKIKELF